jgi:serine/threonine protein phosphatase 1
MASKTYVIADLHGRFDLLEMALAKIEANEPGTVVFVGDYVDRGPQSHQVIVRLIAGPTIPRWKWICLKGNHEDMMRQAFGKSAKLEWWLGNGGGATLLSYGRRADQFADPSIIPQGHIDWIKGLPLYHVDNHRLYVHAGVDPGLSLEDQTEHTLIWKRYSACDTGGFGALHLIHGPRAL